MNYKSHKNRELEEVTMMWVTGQKWWIVMDI